MGKKTEKLGVDRTAIQRPIEPPDCRLGASDEDCFDAFLLDDGPEPLPELDDFWLEQD